MGGNSGTAYWRGFNWWTAAHRTGKCGFHVLGWEKDCNTMAPWQIDIADASAQPFLFGKMFAAGQNADAIVFQRVETRHALAAFYAMKDQFPNKPILSEIDDDIFDVAPYNPASECLKPGSHLTQLAVDQFRNSDGIIVSTPYLKEVYSELNQNIYVVPNSIDIQKWDKAPRKKKAGIRIGWIGSGSHSKDIEILDKVIDPICSRNRDVKFVFCSYFQDELQALPSFLKGRKNVQIVNKWVPILKYPAHMAAQDFDIGLAPLVDNKFNRGKSNLRWLEYSALGIPCVASEVQHFAETISAGKDGFLARTPDHFIAHIQELISNSKLRKTMGRAAHARMQKDFNIDRNIDIYIDAIEDCLSRAPVAAPSMMTGVDTVTGPEMELGPLEVLAE